MGNPTKYRGIDCSWVKGRQLDEFGSLQFKCDGRGRRTKKGDITFTYDSNGRLLSHSNGISFIYDNSGVVGLKQDGKTYIYRKDVQGNIIAILDSTGKVMVRYVYDVWGNHKAYDENGSEITSATHIGNLNPFRYRGYYYDTETKLYFLKTRYYDSEIGRFMTIDGVEYLDPESINGLNLYAYCGNNPVMAVDPNGTAKWWQWLLFGIGAALVVAAAVVLTVATGGAATGLLGAIAVGAAKGALIGAAVGSAVGIAGGAIYSAVTGADMGQSILSGFLMGFGIGAVIGAVIGGAVGGVQYGTFASKSSLNIHYGKHGQEFGEMYSSAKEYAQGAKYVIKNGTKVTYIYHGKVTTGYMRFFGAKGGANYAFVGMRGSRVATYSIRGVKELIKLGITVFGL